MCEHPKSDCYELDIVPAVEIVCLMNLSALRTGSLSAEPGSGHQQATYSMQNIHERQSHGLNTVDPN